MDVLVIVDVLVTVDVVVVVAWDGATTKTYYAVPPLSSAIIAMMRLPQAGILSQMLFSPSSILICKVWDGLLFGSISRNCRT